MTYTGMTDTRLGITSTSYTTTDTDTSVADKATAPATLPDWSSETRVADGSDSSQCPELSEASAALQKIMQQLALTQTNLEPLVNFSMEALQLLTTNLCMQIFMNTNASVSTGTQINTITQRASEVRIAQQLQTQLAQTQQRLGKVNALDSQIKDMDSSAQTLDALHTAIELALVTAQATAANNKADATGSASGTDSTGDTTETDSTGKTLYQLVGGLSSDIEKQCQALTAALQAVPAIDPQVLLTRIGDDVSSLISTLSPDKISKLGVADLTALSALVSNTSGLLGTATTQLATEKTLAVMAEEAAVQVLTQVVQLLQQILSQSGKDMATGMLQAFNSQTIQQMVTLVVQQLTDEAMENGKLVAIPEATRQGSRLIQSLVIKTVANASAQITHWTGGVTSAMPGDSEQIAQAAKDFIQQKSAESLAQAEQAKNRDFRSFIAGQMA